MWPASRRCASVPFARWWRRVRCIWQIQLVRARVVLTGAYAEAALDGLYISRTLVKAARMNAPICVRTYKTLAQVEQAFRSIKTMDLKLRPMKHPS